MPREVSLIFPTEKELRAFHPQALCLDFEINLKRRLLITSLSDKEIVTAIAGYGARVEEVPHKTGRA